MRAEEIIYISDLYTFLVWLVSVMRVLVSYNKNMPPYLSLNPKQLFTVQLFTTTGLV